MKLHHYFSLILFLVSPILQAAVVVSLDRNPVHVNESFQIFFDADEAPEEDPDFSPLQQHFVILNTSQNNSISIINGDYQRSVKWTLQLMPKQVGDVTIPEIRFGDDKTSRFQVSVKEAAQPATGTGSGLIFELSADRESVVVQGQAIITMRLMSDTNITAYEFGELIVDNIDVVTEPLGEVKRYQTRLGDKAYLVLEQKFALFPQSSGSLEIKPVLGQVRLSAASRSVFDPFQTRGEIRSVHSPELKIEVTGINPVFDGQHWLPSASVRLNEVWQDDLGQLKAGEPITRTIVLVAEGLTAAQLPLLAQAEVVGIKQYPDQPVLSDQRSENGVIGQRQQKIALIPTAGGAYTLPEISIPWWNVETGKQQVAKIPARTIQVSAAAQSGLVEPEVKPEPVIPEVQASRPVEVAPQTSSFWVWLSVFLACGWLASGLFWWWSRRGSAAISGEPGQKQLSLSRTTKILKQACTDNNATAARDALLQWAQALDTDVDFKHLNQLSSYFGEPLKSQIDSMNQCLYSANTQDWQAEELWQICEKISDEIGVKARNGADVLPALNP